MNSVQTMSQHSPLLWKQAAQNISFRGRLIWGHSLLICVVLSLPYFFEYIEDRDGFLLNDPILAFIPPVDLSVPVFICIWGTTALLLYRCVSQPLLYITAIYSFAFVLLARIITIYLIPLNPPAGLIPLIDPISNLAYGNADYITKDLFFSGHTSSQFLIFLCLTNTKDRTVALFATLLVGSMVLIQHVHYTVDVLAAPIFTYFCVRLAKDIALKKLYPLPSLVTVPNKVIRA